MTCRWMPFALYVTSATPAFDTFRRMFFALRSTMLEALAAGARARNASSAIRNLRGIKESIGERAGYASPVRGTRTVAADPGADRRSGRQARPLSRRSATLRFVTGARAPIVVAA